MESTLARAAHEFPAVVLTGPRQSGKTTLLKRVFGPTHTYQSLEIPDIRTFAIEDPRGFLDSHPSPIILDEIQYVPELLPYIKEKIDSDRTRMGQFILSASQNLLLSANITESLAGRVAILRLLPLSNREIEGFSELPLVWENDTNETVRLHPSSTHLWENFLQGGVSRTCESTGTRHSTLAFKLCPNLLRT